MKINFILAEEFRAEMGGKQTVLGLYPDSTILLESRAELKPSDLELPEGIERLAFLFNISDASQGTHKFKGQIIDPSGNPHGPEMPLGEAEILKGTSRSLIIETKPFLLKGKGTYQFNFYVDDVLYSFPFHILDRPMEKPQVS